jgi:dUTP pyrophosphatase
MDVGLNLDDVFVPKVLKVLRLHQEAVIPSYAHDGDSGLDLCSVEAVVMKVGQRALVRTGLAIELPKSTEAQIRPRSGLALEHGITVLNSPGTIDHGFRGEICVLLINLGSRDFDVVPGMRIAQLVVGSVMKVLVSESSQLAATTRGGRGFGSSGA